MPPTHMAFVNVVLDEFDECSGLRSYGELYKLCVESGEHIHPPGVVSVPHYCHVSPLAK